MFGVYVVIRLLLLITRASVRGPAGKKNPPVSAEPEGDDHLLSQNSQEGGPIRQKNRISGVELNVLIFVFVFMSWWGPCCGACSRW